MPVPEQEKIQGTLQHRSRQLAVSMYWGPFFRDARYHLLTDQPPENIELLLDPKGNRIHPGDPLGIISAGSRVRIKDIQFATASAATSRSLFTPRFFTWVLLDIPGHDRPAVIVIREEPRNHDAFLKILERYLSTDNISEIVSSYPEEIRNAIAEKRLVEGMNANAIIMAWGNPIQVTKDFENGVPVDRWRYEGERIVMLRDGILLSWADEYD